MRKHVITIHRKTETEIEQAIKDLHERRYEVTFGPVQKTGQGKVFTRDSYNRAIFQQNTQHSVWIAVLQRVTE